MSFASKMFTYKRLGITNLFTVVIYRLALKFGYFQKKQPVKNVSNSTDNVFFTNLTIGLTAENIQQPPLKAFGWLAINSQSKPEWLESILSGKAVKNNQQHWSRLNDFDLDVGDIKAVWELSRFDWLFHFAINYVRTKDEKQLNKLNIWLSDWCQHNPVNQGVNWKCGQEASIRVMHLVATAYLLGQEKKLTNKLAQLIFEHLVRIAPTIYYAMAQDNNHGTSEVAALYIGSLILEKNSGYRNNNQLKKWRKSGQYWLENRANKLISDDGCFSQNSVNYHRLMLDTLSLSEFFRQHLEQEKFHRSFYQQAIKATQWLDLMVEPSTGYAPILGANDGAHLLPVTTCDYLDYRPSVQWAYSLFVGSFIYDTDESFHQLASLFPAKLLDNGPLEQPNSSSLNSSYQLLRNNLARCYIRTPNLKFRPSSCDGLHVDFWLDNENILLSTGSYSYNCQKKWQNYFPSTKAHNTIQFDQCPQMPKLSRFLYNHWLEAKVENRSIDSLTASYTNKLGHFHKRNIELRSNNLTIIDTLSGFKKQATIRWHLPRKNWQLQGNKLLSDKINIDISANVEITKIALVDGFQSRYYLQKEQIPVLEISLVNAGKITTSLNW